MVAVTPIHSLLPPHEFGAGLAVPDPVANKIQWAVMVGNIVIELE